MCYLFQKFLKFMGVRCLIIGKQTTFFQLDFGFAQ